MYYFYIPDGVRRECFCHPPGSDQDRRDIKARVKRLADARHRTPHWLMREAITQDVDRDEKREAFNQEPLKAWEDYRTTGLHVTADEADAWLTQLEQGNDIDPPPCQV